MNENINIEKLELGGQTATLNVLHGELPTQPPIEYKKPISIKGAITSPANYVQAHKDHGIFDVKTSRVEFSYNSGAIYFIFNEDSSLTESFVKGSVTDNPDFLRLDINGSKTYTGKELYRALREATMYFVKPSLVNEFAFIDKDIAAKINADSELSNNGKGNSANKLVTNVDLNHPLPDFELELPVYVGDEPVRFTVEIYFEAKTTHARDIEFRLESTELFKILKTRKKDFLDRELERIKTNLEGVALIEL